MHSQNKSKFLNLWVPVYLPGLFIFILCLLPGSAFPDTGWVAAYAPDKWVHAFLYAVWTVLWKVRRGRTSFPFMLLCMSLWGAGIELFQQYVLTYRSGEWLDWLADIVGIFLGYLLYRMLPKT
jgi:VanZ family protein